MKLYKVIIIKPEFLENKLNIQAIEGFELFHIQPLQTVRPSLVPNQPQIEITYQLIMFKDIIGD